MNYFVRIRDILSVRNSAHYVETAPQEVREAIHAIHTRGDLMIKAFLLIYSLIACGVASVYGAWPATLAIGGAAAALFWASAGLQPGTLLTRCIAGISLQMFCALY